MTRTNLRIFFTSYFGNKRENKNDKKLSKLEALRGFAAVYVLLHHLFSKELLILGKDVSVLFRFGQEAVILFFLLSGFVIQYAYEQTKDKSFKTFFIKRTLRIYIPLLIVLLSNYLLFYFIQDKLLNSDIETFFGNLFMLQDIKFLKPNVLYEPFLGNSPLWSLSYEWWFYFLFFVVINKFKENASNVVYITSTLASISYLFAPNFINRELLYFLIWWLGADMAKLYIKHTTITLKDLQKPLLILLLNIGILFLNLKINNQHSPIGMSPWLELRHFSVAFLLIIIALIWEKARWVGFKQTIGLFEGIAPISFGIYISHWFLVVVANYLDPFITNEYIEMSFYLLICLMYSYVLERIVYVKINRWALSKLKPNSNQSTTGIQKKRVSTSTLYSQSSLLRK